MAPTPKGKIPIDYEAMRAGYPTYRKLPAHIAAHMDALNKNLKPGQPKNTPCCFQISEAFNRAGAEHEIPPNSFRRPNTPLGGKYFIGAVDELEYFLAARYGRGEEIHEGAGTGAGRLAAMQRRIAGRKGILCFRNAGAGAHTELWDGGDIVQNGAPAADGSAMSTGYIWGQPRVLFWEFAGEDGVDPAPAWLRGWWDVWDGQQYYYYFSDQYVVTYTRQPPSSAVAYPARQAANEGTVRLLAGPPATVQLRWNPAGDGITEENFTCIGAAPTMMNGRSNRFGNLVARKMTSFQKKGR